jgi:hypothetical protein
MMMDMRLITIALVAFALSSTLALANTVRHKPSVRTYDLRWGIPVVRSGFLHPSYGNSVGPNGGPAGGLIFIVGGIDSERCCIMIVRPDYISRMFSR